jgi:hypothetical protein
MFARLRPRLSYANCVATLALFLALGGSAWALSRNSVGPRQIKPNAVRSSDVKNEAIKGVDVNEATLGEVPAAGTAQSAHSAGLAQIAKSAEAAESAQTALHASDADTVGGIPPSELGTLGRSNAGGFCEDNDEDGEDCVTVNLNLTRAGRVFVAGSGYTSSSALDDTVGPGSGVDAADRARGSCTIFADGNNVSGPVFSQVTDLDFQPFALNGVSGPLSAGAHDFTVRCQEIDGDLTFDSIAISAVMLGNG